MRWDVVACGMVGLRGLRGLGYGWGERMRMDSQSCITRYNVSVAFRASRDMAEAQRTVEHDRARQGIWQHFPG